MPWNNNEENTDLNKKVDENLNIFDREGSIFIDSNFDYQYSSSFDLDFESIDANQSYYSPFTGSFSETNFSTLDINLDFSESLYIDTDTTIFFSEPSQDPITGEQSLTNSLFNSQSSLSFDRDINFSYSDTVLENFSYDAYTGFYTQTIIYDLDLDISISESLEFLDQETLFISSDESDSFYTRDENLSFDRDIDFSYSERNYYNLVFNPDTGFFSQSSFSSSSLEISFEESVEISSEETFVYLPKEPVKTPIIPGISIQDVVVSESDGNLALTVTLSEETTNTVTVEYATSNNQLNFTESIITTSADGAYDVHVADMDSDGDMDIVASSIHDDTIRWFENNGNINPTFTAATIATNADSVREITVADMDNDGDLDILSASENDDTIAWYENNGAADPTFTKAVIATSADNALDVQVADLDGDGDLDIVSASSLDDTIAWYENDGAANPTWAAADIATNADGATSVFLIDLDKDGDIDILSSSYNDDTIAWYENNGAANPTFTAADIATNIDGAYHVYAEDMDADGDIDILASAAIGDKVVLFKSNGAADPTFTASDIITGFDTPIGLDVKDIDGDGDLDIGIAGNDGLFGASAADKVAWYASDGAANPSWTLIQSTTNPKDGAENVFIADIDGDGDLDGVSASHNDDTIALYINEGTTNNVPGNRIAQSGEDYTSASGVLTFEPGTKTATIIIPITNDKLPENKENFLFNSY